MEGYNEVRKISKDEKVAIKVVPRCCFKISSNGVFDYINTVDNVVVKIKS